MRLADYVAIRCYEAGATKVFLVTGGGAMHLNDAFGRNKKFTTICFHHEQAAAMAAESYYRTSNEPVVLNVTTGPGGINALNGVYGAYTDSQGIIVISGQVKDETYLRNYSTPLRQLGDQEVDIVTMCKPVVKYSTVLRDPTKVKEVIDKALFLITFGRPGPVWIDIPVDVSNYQIDPERLKGWDGNINELSWDADVTENTRYELIHLKTRSSRSDIDYILSKLALAKRPVLMAGTGVRISGQVSNFLKIVEKLGIPTVTGFNAHDIVSFDNPCYAGKPGTVGDRAGNFTVQNSDLIIVLGCRLNIRQISYNYKNFASKAYRIVIDVDRAELEKPTLNIDYKVHTDLKDFIPKFLDELKDYIIKQPHREYLDWCKERVNRYPVVVPEYQHKERLVNPYIFVENLVNSLDSNAVIVTGNASACIITFQTIKIKHGQRLFSNSGSASMGYELPAAIGACLARDRNRVVCMAGDGSIMMNLQELQTIVGYNLPIKIIILNNEGYISIKQTQWNYFSDNVFGTSPRDGVTLPDFIKVGSSFGIPSLRIETITDWNSDQAKQMMDNDGPALFEIMCDPQQLFSPKLAAKKLEDGTLLAPSLENMSPFLPDEEMQNNILK